MTTRCPTHDIARGSPCRRCGTLECPWCLAKDPERWCAACAARRPRPAFLDAGRGALARYAFLLLGLMGRPARSAKALADCGLLAAVGLMLPVFFECFAAQFVVMRWLAAESPGTSFIIALALVGLPWAAWVLVVAPVEWLLLRALGAPARLERTLTGAVLALAPSALLGLVPFAGPLAALTWSAVIQAGHHRGAQGAKGPEAAISAIMPLVIAVLTFLALRLERQVPLTRVGLQCDALDFSGPRVHFESCRGTRRSHQHGSRAPHGLSTPHAQARPTGVAPVVGGGGGG